MKFSVERPIADQILESILEEPHKWKATYSGGSAVIQQHRSGLEIWVYNSPSDVKFWGSAATLATGKFTLEEKTRIFNAVMQLREETEGRNQKGDKKKIIGMLNENPMKLLLALVAVFIVILVIL